MRWEGNTCLSHLTRSRQYPHFHSDQASKYSHEYGPCFIRKTRFSPLCSLRGLDVAARPTTPRASSRAAGLFFPLLVNIVMLACADVYCLACMDNHPQDPRMLAKTPSQAAFIVIYYVVKLNRRSPNGPRVHNYLLFPRK